MTFQCLICFSNVFNEKVFVSEDDNRIDKLTVLAMFLLNESLRFFR